MIRHPYDCECGLCLPHRLRVAGASLSLSAEGKIVAQWANVPDRLRDLAKEHRAALVSLLERERAFRRMTGSANLGMILAICEISTRPEAGRLADLILNGGSRADILAVGMTLALLIQDGGESDPGPVLFGGDLRSLIVATFPDAVEPSAHDLYHGKSPKRERKSPQGLPKPEKPETPHTRTREVSA